MVNTLTPGEEEEWDCPWKAPELRAISQDAVRGATKMSSPKYFLFRLATWASAIAGAPVSALMQLTSAQGCTRTPKG